MCAAPVWKTRRELQHLKPSLPKGAHVAASQAPNATAPASQPGVGLVLILSAVIGLAAGLGVVAFLSVEHTLMDLWWDELPEHFGWAEPAGWWVYAVLLVGAAGVWLALKLPGHGAHRPLDGLGFDIGPRAIASVVLAALITLSVGAVVGPEMPLMAVGSAIAAALAPSIPPQFRQVLMLAGATSAITMILGNPVTSGILVLEVMALRGSPGGKQSMMTVLPVLVAMGTGYLIQVGVGDWGGVGESSLAVPNLPAYPDVQGIDLLMLVPVAIITAVLGVAVVYAGTALQRQAEVRPLMVILAAGAVVATCAVAARAITGEPVDLVLFSGQEQVPDVLTIASVSTLVVVLFAKVIAYAVSVGSGFRGGLIFPAIYLGVVHASIASQLYSDTSVSALAAAGIAAAVGALLRLPFTATALAVLLCAGAGLAVTTPAILGAVIGVLIRVAYDAKFAEQPEAADDSRPADHPAAK